MARFSKGRRALAISDRSGVAFPYKEMVQEWTGAWVLTSEFEVKQPQLQPHPVGADPQGLLHARPSRVASRAGSGSPRLLPILCTLAIISLQYF